ncbi:hypothetical protein GTGU_03602 [Trabulsiella guamensis ATCC 49490]|uniref:Uncharacterized protein n=1 Tax=Trabulsiella guamensis ATCC 49490 TaxID=1005994 RepID=A0A084ZUE0_9ENTR|nr:hypothetical protein [Trabulsiella guamensis]KFC01085.1 hypothetical protein GTGU_03602 [Trabulsiella guamensis ATCC 49490]
MTEVEKLMYIRDVALPYIEKNGLTIRLNGCGEITFYADDPSVMKFIDDVRENTGSSLARYATANVVDIMVITRKMMNELPRTQEAGGFRADLEKINAELRTLQDRINSVTTFSY